MAAHPRLFGPAKFVVAVVAHALSVVFLVFVAALVGSLTSKNEKKRTFSWISAARAARRSIGGGTRSGSGD